MGKFAIFCVCFARLTSWLITYVEKPWASYPFPTVNDAHTTRWRHQIGLDGSPMGHPSKFTGFNKPNIKTTTTTTPSCAIIRGNSKETKVTIADYTEKMFEIPYMLLSWQKAPFPQENFFFYRKAFSFFTRGIGIWYWEGGMKFGWEMGGGDVFFFNQKKGIKFFLPPRLRGARGMQSAEVCPFPWLQKGGVNFSMSSKRGVGVEVQVFFIKRVGTSLEVYTVCWEGGCP